MKKTFTIQDAVISTVSSMNTSHKTMSSINFVRTNVLTLFLLFCFWQMGIGQTVFTNSPTVPTVLGEYPVGINVTSPTANLHVDGNVRFENLNLSAGVQQYLTWQPNGDIGWQNGTMPLPGINPWETLHWNGVDWQPTDLLTTVPGSGVGISLLPGSQPLSKLHVNDYTNTDNYALWTNSTSTQGGRIGQQANSNVFQIRQEENANMEFWTDGANTTTPRMTIDNTGWVGIGTQARLGTLGLYQSIPTGWSNTSPSLAAPNFSVAGGDIECSRNIFAGQDVYFLSDIRLKTNIKELNNWKDIFKIKAYSYNYIGRENDGLSYGFIAQDVQKVFPELTATWRGGGTVNYIGFIPFLAQGLKEHEERFNSIETSNESIGDLKVENQLLNSKIETMKIQNEVLENRLADLEAKFNSIRNLPCIQDSNKGGNTINNTDVKKEQPVLEQNEPNPFNEITIIRYYVPEINSNTKIEIRNSENKIVTSFPIVYDGYGNITISAGTLSSGSYFYSLIVDGQLIDIKKMVLLK